jgi:transposase
MGKTIKKHYDRYTLAFKKQAIKLADHPHITAKAVAKSLGIHPVMLYRWRMEKKNGDLRENRSMRKRNPSEKLVKNSPDPLLEKEAELLKAKKRIKELEKSLAARQEELDILKKAKRFFSKAKR